MAITKAVIPVAGLGTRLLPATKSQPKEMLPIGRKPIVQYVVEELAEAGLNNILFVTGRKKRSIEDHFDYYYELEDKLRKAGKLDLLEQIRKVSDLAHFTYTRQKEQLGNAHAVWQTEPIVGTAPFCVQWGDDVVIAKKGEKSFLAQMIEIYEATDADAVVATIDTDDEGAAKYAIVETVPEGDQYRATSIIEKPGPDKTESRLASVSGFLFKPVIFKYIKALDPKKGSGGEYVLADALKAMIKDGKKVYTSHIKGRRIDIGNKLLYMQGAVEVAMEHDEIGKDFKKYLKSLKL